MRVLFGVVRLAAAVAIIAAIVGQFVESLSRVEDVGLFIVNFFSYFTILSNALAAIVMLVGAWYAFTRPDDPEWYNLVRACAVTYMTTTLVVYNLLLRGYPVENTVGWSNEILHVWAPLVLLVDWVFAPGRRPIPWQRLWSVAIFPIVWVVYTLIRGPIVGFYPYPFLNPANGGYNSVTVYVIAIAAFILLVGSGILALSRRSWPYPTQTTDASRPESGREASVVGG